MTDLETTLAELARVRSGSEPIVSLYLDVRWGDEQQRERVRLYVQEAARRALAHYPEGAPGRDGLARTLARIQAWVAGLAREPGATERRGVALFACESLGLWRPLELATPLESHLATDAVPRLARLARLAREATPVLVVAPGPDGAEVFAVSLGAVEAEEGVHGPSPRAAADAHGPGPPRVVAGEGPPARHARSDRDDRKDERRARRARRAAVAEVTARLDRRPRTAVVLLGPARTVAAFEKELPERVAVRVVARLRRPPGWTSGDGARRTAVLGAAAEGAREAARASGDGRLDALVGEALRGGVAVVGPEDVVLAVNEGRVQTLFLEEDFRRAGWRCDNCDALGAAEGAERCPYCGGDLRAVLELGEALVARTLAGGGAVQVVPHARRLHGYRGVGAFLRQSAASGLRGASPPWPTAPGPTPP